MEKNTAAKRWVMLIRQIWGWWLMLLICGGAISMELVNLDPPLWEWETAEITVAGISDMPAPGIPDAGHSDTASGKQITASDGSRYFLGQDLPALTVGQRCTVIYFPRNGLGEIRCVTQTDTSRPNPQRWISLWKGDQILRIVLLLALVGVIALMIREFRSALDRVRIMEYRQLLGQSPAAGQHSL